MIPLDTWAVIEVKDDEVVVECPFDNIRMTVSENETGHCDVGDILSTESGGWLFLQEKELSDITDEYQKIFDEYLKQKGFKILKY